ncbi:hypothetical protein ES332_D08G177400v1 [Gossypium tomentosum]|uniref:Uncharacterized protein n=1 Tax=Gossypium tomentosum TaxID=34277 RepID=A0A5D2JVV8_GOSTO|nr:hypothetical protein ES332_D08G177400v1 [Gossypium tomentosum]
MDVVHIVDTHGRCSNYCHGAAYSMFPMNIPCACYLIYCCSDLKFAWALVEVAMVRGSERWNNSGHSSGSR